MKDPRIEKLRKNLLNFSVAAKGRKRANRFKGQ